MLLSKATYKWGQQKKNQQKSNNMQVLWRVSFSLTAKVYFTFYAYAGCELRGS